MAEERLDDPHGDALHHDRSYFDAMYADTLDPWGFETSWYERRKFGLTVASLPKARFRRCLEPGCATGSLTQLLSERCDEVIAYDFVPAVVRAATDRFVDHANVQVRTGEFPTYEPGGSGDLVVWSEVAYYLTDDGVERALAQLDRWLDVGGHLVAVHYTGETDYPKHGREIGRILDGVGHLHRVTTLVDERFELGVWQRSAARLAARV
jgi:SAM-dependent methyltransferase